MASKTTALIAAIWLASALGALAQQERPTGAEGRPYRHTMWDLELGSHARELPGAEYTDYACGTNGGPPSLPVPDWEGFGECRPEAATGWREVYFRYDDELEYRSLARDPDRMGMHQFEGTTEFQIPVITSALFDENGFLVGVRMVSDPRTDVLTREQGGNLAGVFEARFGGPDMECVDLPRQEGETPYRGALIKWRCRSIDSEAGVRNVLEKHYYRKPGQNLLDPVTGLRTVGYFVSETRFEQILLEPVENPQARLASLPAREPSEVETLAAQIRECPGCDLAGANLKRADLRDANLEDANLEGANLHGALLVGANLRGTDLAGANLNKSDLRQADVSSANMIEVWLYEGRLDGADLSGADMSGARAPRLQMIRSKASGVKAAGADLRYSRLSNSDFSGADLSDSALQGVQLARSNLAGASLVGAALWHASLTEANLSDVDAQFADMTGADLRGSDLTDADLSSANLTLAILTDANLTGANLSDTRLPAGIE